MGGSAASKRLPGASRRPSCRGDAMKALDRKVLRDLRLLWSQALTIALVVASGIGGFIATLSAVDSLALARDSFYAEGHFADVFASVKRAPDGLAERIATLPGIADVQATVEAMARITVPGSVDPVMGQLIGWDERHAQRLNRVQLRSGQWPAAGTRAGGDMEAVVTESFAGAPAQARCDRVGAGQRQAAHAAHHRHGAVARIHLRRPDGHARHARLRRLLGRQGRTR